MSLDVLLDTLRQAKAGSRALDRTIWEGFGSPARSDGVPAFAGFLGIGAFSTSVQDAITLAKAVLPPLTKIQVETYTGGEFHHCEVESDDGEARANNAPNAAIAVVIATVELLTSTSTTGGDHG